jgi:hypothetical protein
VSKHSYAVEDNDQRKGDRQPAVQLPNPSAPVQWDLLFPPYSSDSLKALGQFLPATCERCAGLFQGLTALLNPLLHRAWPGQPLSPLVPESLQLFEPIGRPQIRRKLLLDAVKALLASRERSPCPVQMHRMTYSLSRIHSSCPRFVQCSHHVEDHCFYSIRQGRIVGGRFISQRYQKRIQRVVQVMKTNW